MLLIDSLMLPKKLSIYTMSLDVAEKEPRLTVFQFARKIY